MKINIDWKRLGKAIAIVSGGTVAFAIIVWLTSISPYFLFSMLFTALISILYFMLDS